MNSPHFTGGLAFNCNITIKNGKRDMNMNSMLRIYRELHTKGLLSKGSSDHRLNRRKTGLRLCYNPLQNPNHNRGTTLSLL